MPSQDGADLAGAVSGEEVEGERRETRAGRQGAADLEAALAAPADDLVRRQAAATQRRRLDRARGAEAQRFQDRLGEVAALQQEALQDLVVVVGALQEDGFRAVPVEERGRGDARVGIAGEAAMEVGVEARHGEERLPDEGHGIAAEGLLHAGRRGRIAGEVLSDAPVGVLSQAGGDAGGQAGVAGHGLAHGRLGRGGEVGKGRRRGAGVCRQGSALVGAGGAALRQALDQACRGLGQQGQEEPDRRPVEVVAELPQEGRRRCVAAACRSGGGRVGEDLIEEALEVQRRGHDAGAASALSGSSPASSAPSSSPRLSTRISRGPGPRLGPTMPRCSRQSMRLAARL